MADEAPTQETISQAWRFLGGGLMLLAIGIFGLLAGYKFSSSSDDARVRGLEDQVRGNRARIGQLEDDYERRGIPVPAPTTSTSAPTTSTSTRRTTTTTRSSRPTSTSSSTSTTTTTTATTSTTTPCRISVAVACIRPSP